MKLNPEFMAKYGTDNMVTMFYGHKIEDLSREELLAMVRFLSAEKERDRKERDRDSQMFARWP